MGRSVSCTEEAVQFTIDVTVRADLADALLSAASVRGRTPAAVMAEIVEIVLVDGLVGALLDDGK